MKSSPGRGAQLSAGAKAAKGDWFLFLHADTMLDLGWATSVMVFTSDNRNRERGAVFTFALDDDSRAARWLEKYGSVAQSLAWPALWRPGAFDP